MTFLVFIYLFTFLFLNLCIHSDDVDPLLECLFVGSVCLFVYLFVCLFVDLSVYLLVLFFVTERPCHMAVAFAIKFAVRFSKQRDGILWRCDKTIKMND